LNNFIFIRKNLLNWYLSNGVYFSISQLRKEKEAISHKTKEAYYDIIDENNHSYKGTVNSNSTVSSNTLEELKNELEKFDGCSLKRTAKNLVFADGNPESKIMLLGEAPGEEEDKISKPFVGLAGKLLDKMLAAIGQDRNNTYLSNIIFWRPPGNRNPTEEEISSCLPFVFKHLELVKPKILILAGAIATKTILNKNNSGIIKMRGTWHDLEVGPSKIKIKTIPIYHPAFLLRQPARKREAWEDLKNIKREIERIT